jgi:hypothetical protein
MDYEVIQAVSKGFQAARVVVLAVAAATIAMIEGFKAATFFCPPLIAYYTQWQQNIRKTSDALAEHMQKLADNLERAIGDHRRGDVAGKQYFGQGGRL